MMNSRHANSTCKERWKETEKQIKHFFPNLFNAKCNRSNKIKGKIFGVSDFGPMLLQDPCLLLKLFDI